jgi:hypothetical protein
MATMKCRTSAALQLQPRIARFIFGSQMYPFFLKKNLIVRRASGGNDSGNIRRNLSGEKNIPKGQKELDWLRKYTQETAQYFERIVNGP